MSFLHIRKIITSLAVVVCTVVFVYTFSTPARAQGLLSFGGLVVASFYCNGTDNYLLTVIGPSGGLYVYDPKTPQAFSSHNLGIGTGMWVLGLYTPITFGCQIDAAPVRVVVPSLGIISPTVGTSPTF